MSDVRSYKDLLIWQKGIDLVVQVYKAVKAFPKEELYALSDQIKRSSVSVPSNIAEGQARQHTPEFRQFLHVSLGSLAELDTQIIIANKLGYLSERSLSPICNEITELRKMIFSLITKLK
ncbi:MAG: four helix bundle protein [Desulfobacterales bacterium]|nr:four helix bundle protein [Desulfobacterales bacterium]